MESLKKELIQKIQKAEYHGPWQDRPPHGQPMTKATLKLVVDKDTLRCAQAIYTLMELHNIKEL